MVELASVLAREEFSDRPRCVCPVIAAFLRGWNDRAAYSDRQRLWPYAQRIVGTRGNARLTRERRDMCLEWVGADLGNRRLARALRRLRLRGRIAVFCGPGYALRLTEGAPEYAARVLYGRRDVEGAFVLLDAMLATGATARLKDNRLNGSRPLGVTPNGHGPRPRTPSASNGKSSTESTPAPTRATTSSADRLARQAPSQLEHPLDRDLEPLAGRGPGAT